MNKMTFLIFIISLYCPAQLYADSTATLKNEWRNIAKQEIDKYVRSYKDVTHFNVVDISYSYFDEGNKNGLDEVNLYIKNQLQEKLQDYVKRQFKSNLADMPISTDEKGAAQMNFKLYLLKISFNHYVAGLVLECPPIIGYDERAFFANDTIYGRDSMIELIKRNISEMMENFAIGFYKIRNEP